MSILEIVYRGRCQGKDVNVKLQSLSMLKVLESTSRTTLITPAIIIGRASRQL